jgi:hypothetical protein
VPGTSSGDGFAVKVENNGASCFLFESDIYVMAETDNTTFFQIKIGDAYMLVFTKSGDSIEIKEATSTSGGRTTIATVSTETWFRVRVEYYLNGDLIGKSEIVSTVEIEKITFLTVFVRLLSKFLIK